MNIVYTYLRDKLKAIKYDSSGIVRPTRTIRYLEEIHQLIFREYSRKKTIFHFELYEKIVKSQKNHELSHYIYLKHYFEEENMNYHTVRIKT